MNTFIFDKTRLYNAGKTYKTLIMKNKVVDELRFLLNSFDRVDKSNVKAFNHLVHTTAYKFHKTGEAITLSQRNVFLNLSPLFTEKEFRRALLNYYEVGELRRLFGQAPIDVSLVEVNVDDENIKIKDVVSSEKDWLILRAYHLEYDVGVKLIDELSEKLNSFLISHNMEVEDILCNANKKYLKLTSK